jgi:hypothetical protein
MRVQPTILARVIQFFKIWYEYYNLVIRDILDEGYYSFSKRLCFLVLTENGLFANSSVW